MTRPSRALLTKSASNQQEVTDQLGLQVRKAVEVLIQSLDKADQDHGRELLDGMSEAVLYESALTVMMRLVFLFCAEERELIPTKPFPVYEQNYSVSTISKQLREIADQHGEELLERRYDGWPRLLSSFRAVYGGLAHDDVYMPAYGGRLFDPDRFPFLEGRKPKTCWSDTEATPLPVNNRTVLHLLEALQLLQVKVPGGGPAEARRLSFRALDIEQIGHVYEGLLDHTAKRATEPMLGLIGKKEPEIPVQVLERERAKGDKSFFEFLKNECRSSRKWENYLDVELDDRQERRLRTACGNDDALFKRVKPFAGLVRDDTFGYPVVVPEKSVFVTAGTDRRSSGTHYTPRSLTEPIVQYTLEPLVYVGPAEGKPKSEWKLKSAADLLDLKICDMACGSGAFLVQAARYMSERLMEAWDAAKEQYPDVPGITPEGQPSTGEPNESLIPDDPAERTTYAMRIVAQRCLYGVDINPLATEMAKLSLWLLTLAKDKPFEFLDHAIRCGDSLVGLHDLEQLRHFSLKPDDDDAVLFKGPLDNAVDEAINLRLKLEDMPSNTVEDVEAQEKLLKEADDKIARLRCAADLLVAGEFWGEGTKDKQEKVRHAAVVAGHYVENGPTDEFEEKAEKERRGQRMFHWPLEFPEVIVKRSGFDAFVGNPPFMRGTKIQTNISEAYLRGLLHMRSEVNGNADLCAHFYRAAFSLLNTTGGFGLLATNTISQGDTRECGLEVIVSQKGTLYRADTSLKWPGLAAVVVSVGHVTRQEWSGTCVLDGNSVASIDAFLSSHASSAAPPQRLAVHWTRYHNGSFLNGTGFVIEKHEAEQLLQGDSYSEVVRPYIGGRDSYSLPKPHIPERFIIYFGKMKEGQAKNWPLAYRILQERVYPERKSHKTKQLREKWWQFKRPTPDLYADCSGLSRVIAKTQVSRTFAFLFLPATFIFDQRLIVFPDDRSATFSVLQSSIHQVWAERYSATLKNDMSYTPKDCFETFPFPSDVGTTAQIGEEYHQLRSTRMETCGEGLTALYHRFHDQDETSADLQKLRDLHVEMDQAVAAAYGWGDLKLGHGFHETKQGLRFTINEPARREVLQRLLKLNNERYAEEVKQGLHDKKNKVKKTATPKKSKKSQPATRMLFGDDDDEEGG
ncbi:MAG: DNA methyltransferase [Planctomycetaceae bacterium]